MRGITYGDLKDRICQLFLGLDVVIAPLNIEMQIRTMKSVRAWLMADTQSYCPTVRLCAQMCINGIGHLEIQQVIEESFRALHNQQTPCLLERQAFALPRTQ
jgi:hypothetical protein